MDSPATQKRLTEIIDTAAKRIAVIVVRSTKQRVSLNAMTEIIAEVAGAIRDARNWFQAPKRDVVAEPEANPFDDQEPMSGDTPTVPRGRKR